MMETGCRVIGLRQVSFTGKDGTAVNGTTVFYTEAIDPRDGVGQAADRCFLSTGRIAELGFKLALGQTVEVLYGKNGKVRTLRLVKDESADGFIIEDDG